MRRARSCEEDPRGTSGKGPWGWPEILGTGIAKKEVQKGRSAVGGGTKSTFRAPGEDLGCYPWSSGDPWKGVSQRLRSHWDTRDGTLITGKWKKCWLLHLLEANVGCPGMRV